MSERSEAPRGRERRTEPKRYDRAYFDRWYRDRGRTIGSRAALVRNVSLAVAVTESVLARPLRGVLDVGCGEGRWQPVLHRLRPKASYLGIDPSEYVVERYGTRRNVRHGSFEELSYQVFDRPFDLVVCSDVLHYLTPGQIEAGIGALSERVGGVALLEVFTGGEDVEGDHVGFHRRAAGWYRKTFEAAGLVAIGLQMYVPAEVAEVLDELDFPGDARPG